GFGVRSKPPSDPPTEPPPPPTPPYLSEPNPSQRAPLFVPRDASPPPLLPAEPPPPRAPPANAAKAAAPPAPQPTNGAEAVASGQQAAPNPARPSSPSARARGMGIEHWAEISAELHEKPDGRERVLAGQGIDEFDWTFVDARWTSALDEETERGQ